jgi:glucan phosphoethanolaminetransferase (alkaline phosphatase superfamily)
MTPKDNRMTALVCCAVAALLLAYSAFSHRWLENRQMRGATIGLSLLSMEACVDDTCQSKSNFELIAEARKYDADRASSVWAPMGLATMVLMLIASAALLVSAAVGFKKKRLDLKMLPTTAALLALMIALITGCIFVAKKPGGAGGVGVGLGFWAFGIGCVLGIAGAQLMNKLIKPVDPDMPEEMI